MNNPKNRRLVITISLVVLLLILGTSAYLATAVFHVQGINFAAQQATPTLEPFPSPTPTLPSTTTPSSTAMAVPTLPVVTDTRQIMGLDGGQGAVYSGISWVRIGYPTCGWGDLREAKLKQTIDNYHQKGVRVLLTICQGPNDARLYRPAQLTDAAQGNPDAVQCGNEQMKYDAAVSFLYIPPNRFAEFFDRCEKAMHSVRPDMPVLLGSLDPHVGGIDYFPLLNQVSYLNQMQSAMNSTVRPGGNWDWRKQTLGLIDSWHNGWNNGGADASVNSLQGLFSFWAQQFGVDRNSGQLGKHLWVVEGTGCFKGCGVNPNNSYQVATSHILSLITDVQTSLRYKVPFFFFSGRDFMDQGTYWPIGVLTVEGRPKPLRQDQAMGVTTLPMSCPSGSVVVSNQIDLLAKMYQGCQLPGNYVAILMS